MKLLSLLALATLVGCGASEQSIEACYEMAGKVGPLPAQGNGYQITSSHCEGDNLQLIAVYGPSLTLDTGAKAKQDLAGGFCTSQYIRPYLDRGVVIQMEIWQNNRKVETVTVTGADC